MREISRPVVRPSEIAAHYILGSLQPFKADHRRGRGLGAARFDCPPSKTIDLLSRGGGLGLQGAALLRHPVPRIGHGFVEQFGIEPMDDAPGVAAYRDNFLALTKPLATWAINYNGINLVGGPRRDGPDGSITDLVPFFLYNIADQSHDTFIIWPCAVGHALAASLGI